MKKILICLPLIILSFQSSAFDSEEYMSKETQNYVIPCVAAIGASMILGDQSTLSAGLSTCVGIGVYQYATREQRVDDNAVNKKIHDLANEIKDQVKENDQIAKENYSVYRDTIRGVVSAEFEKYNDRFLRNAKMYKKLKKVKSKPVDLDIDKIVDRVVEKMQEEK